MAPYRARPCPCPCRAVARDDAGDSNGDGNSDHVPAMWAVREAGSQPPPDPVLDRDGVRMLLDEADRRYPGVGRINLSARVEFCRARGIDYTRASEFLPVIVALTAAMAAAEATEKAEDDTPQEGMSSDPPPRLLPSAGSDPARLLKRPRHPWLHKHKHKRAEAVTGDAPPDPAPPTRALAPLGWWLLNLAYCVDMRSKKAVIVVLIGRPYLRILVSGTTSAAFMQQACSGCCPLCGANPCHHPTLCPQLPPSVRGLFA